MKILLKIMLIFVLLGSFAVSSADWWGNGGGETYICKGGGCGIEEGIDKAKGTLENIEKDKKLSEYIVGVTLYVASFISLVAVIFIIYAGFNILVSGGDEEKVKTSKKIILYVVLGVVLIWLARSIYVWLEGVLTKAG